MEHALDVTSALMDTVENIAATLRSYPIAIIPPKKSKLAAGRPEASRLVLHQLSRSAMIRDTALTPNLIL